MLYVLILANPIKYMDWAWRFINLRFKILTIIKVGEKKNYG